MKSLALILITLLFFTGCGGNTVEDSEGEPSNADGGVQSTPEDSSESADASAPQAAFFSTIITCTGGNTTLNYDLRRAIEGSSCDNAESNCCEVHLFEPGNSQVITKPNLSVNQCNLFDFSLKNSRGLPAPFTAEDHEDKINLHLGMRCVESINI